MGMCSIEVLFCNSDSICFVCHVTSSLYYFRGRKTKKNRHFREAVRTGRATGDLGTIGAFSDVSRLDCEEAMVGLQVTTGCSMRLCEEPALVSELIVTYTKALAEAPYRLEAKCNRNHTILSMYRLP